MSKAQQNPLLLKRSAGIPPSRLSFLEHPQLRHVIFITPRYGLTIENTYLYTHGIRGADALLYILFYTNHINLKLYKKAKKVLNSAKFVLDKRIFNIFVVKYRLKHTLRCKNACFCTYLCKNIHAHYYANRYLVGWVLGICYTII